MLRQAGVWKDVPARPSVLTAAGLLLSCVRCGRRWDQASEHVWQPLGYVGCPHCPPLPHTPGSAVNLDVIRFLNTRKCSTKFSWFPWAGGLENQW